MKILDNLEGVGWLLTDLLDHYWLSFQVADEESAWGPEVHALSFHSHFLFLPWLGHSNWYLFEKVFSITFKPTYLGPCQLKNITTPPPTTWKAGHHSDSGVLTPGVARACDCTTSGPGGTPVASCRITHLGSVNFFLCIKNVNIKSSSNILPSPPNIILLIPGMPRSSFGDAGHSDRSSRNLTLFISDWNYPSKLKNQK